MARGGLRIDGLNAVVRALVAMGLDVDDLKDAFSNIAGVGAKVAAGFAPKQSGRLAGDIRGNRAKAKAVITAGRTSVPYAGPINYGWAAHNIEPAGFMQKADQQMRPYALRRLEQEINYKIRQKGLA